jgi:hypothetical protein
MSTLRATLIAAIISHSLVVLAILFAWLGPATGVGGNFCEAAREGLIKQPANTFSNLAFAVFGILAAWQLDKGKFAGNINAITRSSFFSKFFCILMVLLSPGSMAMHATETFWGGYFDMLSMYLIAAVMFCYALERMFNLKISHFITFFIVVLVICHYFHFEMSDVKFPFVGFGGNFIFGVFIVSAMLLETVNHFMNKTDIQIKWAYFAIFTFILAFLIWLTGRNDHPWCHPYSYLQAHAIWHILDATALYFLFRFYVSENDKRYLNEVQ